MWGIGGLVEDLVDFNNIGSLKLRHLPLSWGDFDVVGSDVVRVGVPGLGNRCC